MGNQPSVHGDMVQLSPQLSTPPHVLIVDDEDAVREMMRRALERAGYKTTVCTSGSEVLEMLAQLDFDVIVSDINMPDLNGLQMMCRVKDEKPHAQVIFATGVPSVETAAQAVAFGAFRYLSKPIEPQELCVVVEQAVLAHHELAHQRALAEANREVISIREATARSFADALDRLWMAYQPIFDARTRRVIACEALVRSSHPELCHPGVLFESAEGLDQLQELGRAIRRTAPLPLADHDEGLLFVNLHSSDLLDESLYDPASPLAKNASRIVLEITERASLEDISGVTEKVERLRQMGFQIAVDDLGAGYSGLNALALLEPQYVKLDMSMVRDVHQSNTKRTLVRAVTHLSHELKAKVVAEGVETAQELEVLVELGCDSLQGFLLGRPVRQFSTP